MRRRTALKNIGLLVGGIISTPSALNILRGCQSAQTTHNYIFFSAEEGKAIMRIIDIILPKTDTPSGSELKIPQFMDTYIHDVMGSEDQDFYKKTMQAFINITLQAAKKTSISSLTDEDYDNQLAFFLKSNEMEKYNNQQNQEDMPEEMMAYIFITRLRDTSIWAYRISEYIGENVLAYAPIPGQQKGCVDLQEATGGKAWSL